MIKMKISRSFKFLLQTALMISTSASATNWAQVPSSGAVAGRPQLLLKSAKVNQVSDTVTLPLRHGTMKDGSEVWYVITDTDNQAAANSLGVLYAPKLTHVPAVAVRKAAVGSKGELIFESGTVDFSPRHAVVPGMAPNYFPPARVTPGSVGDARYSPFVTVVGRGSAIYNAPIVAFGVNASQISFCSGQVNYDLVHDKVAAICPETRSVTLRLTHGFSQKVPIIYLSFDANMPLAAALESSTLAPLLNSLKGTNSLEPLYAFANGQVGKANPERQGFNSALAGEGSPLNIFQDIPTLGENYSPMWSAFLGIWTQNAIEAGKRHRITSGADVFSTVNQGLITGPNGGAYGATGLLINCPVVARLK